jgi:hypothetical protein
MIAECSCTQTSGVSSEETHALLYLLEQHFTRLIGVVDESKSKLIWGEKTEFVIQLEAMQRDPLPNMVDMSKKIDSIIEGSIDVIVKGFFRTKNALIKSAYRAKSFSSNLYYAIVLHEDNADNRSAIYDFFDTYYFIPGTEKFPVYFQFVPQHLEDKLYVRETIDLTN